MILLSFAQGQRITPIAVFDSLESGQAFLQNVPGYQKYDERIEGYAYSYEEIRPEQFGDYMEIEYRGNRLPLSRFMFDSDEVVDVVWQTIPHLDQPDQALVDGGLKVDAYVVDHTEAKQYIERREQGFERVRKELEQRGYTVSRQFAGSEDGEAIIYQAAGETNQHILVYLDPEFQPIIELETAEFEAWLERLMNEHQ